MTDHQAAKEKQLELILQISELVKAKQDLTAQLAAKDAVIGELVSALEFLVNGEPKNGEQDKACTFCDMGGAGYSTLGEGHHDDIRDVCPVFKAEQALAKHRESADKGE